MGCSHFVCVLVDLLMLYSRRSAEAAENFNVYFVLTPNTFAYLAPWRDFIYFFSRKGAKNAKNFNVSLCLPQMPLRALRLGEILYIFSLAEAQRPQRISMLLL